MTRSLDEANDLSALDARVLREIHTDGWQITGVVAPEQEQSPEFAYSIGFFHTMEHPEVILFGLPLKTSMSVVNAIGREIRGGMHFETGRNYQGILNYPYLCCFKEVDHKYYREHVAYALWFYESDPFPMLQCVWSDHRGHFPWDGECSPYARDAQPMHLLAPPACSR